MTEPLTAGDPLSPRFRPSRPGSASKGTASPDRTPPVSPAPDERGSPDPYHAAKGYQQSYDPPWDEEPPPPRRPRGGGGPPRRPRRRPSLLRRIIGGMFALLVLGILAVSGLGYLGYQRFSADLPDVDGLRNYQPRQMSRVYAGDSRLLSELATERRIFVPYSAIPDLVKRAFVSAEDQNFFTHKGVDPVAILRAAATDIMQYGQGRRPIGASTITQQVAKNMLLGSELSMSRKIREALLAIRIEQNLTKERILELYLNEIYLGMSAYGVAAAAQTYFDKPLDDLTIPEAAFLAALPKGPNNYNPFRFPDAARIRRDWVLDRMADDHVITAEQAAAAKATAVTPSAYQRPEMVTGADYFAEEVRRQLIAKFGEAQTTQGGLTVRTSLDPVLQVAADKALRDGLVRYDLSHGGWHGPVAHLDVSAALLKTAWPTALANVIRPAGMLPEWRLAVVLDEGDRDARLGFLDRTANPNQPVARILPTQLGDFGWSRLWRDGKLSGGPRRMSDIAAPGDVVMVELSSPPIPAAPPPPPNPTNGHVSPAPTPTLPSNEKLLFRQIPTVEGALVAIDPATNRVLALSGGWSYEMSQFNRATQAARQPGSSFKPFVYLTAMEQDISPSQRFLDAPFVLDLGAAGKWRPNNYELDFNGPTPVRIALEKSLNLVTVRIADHIGMEQVAQTAIGFHIVDNMPRVLPAALGAVDTTVLREAAGYAGLDSGGKEVVPTLIDSVQDSSGRVIWRAPGLTCQSCDDPTHLPVIVDRRQQVADAASTFQVVNMMEGVVTRGTGTLAAKGLDRQIAGKTGTSQDFNDAWFSGFTPDLVTAVWIGFDTPASLGDKETGGAVAAPIWNDFMTFALKTRPKLKFIPPPGVTMASWDSGYGTVTDAFKPGQEPGASAPITGDDGTVAADATPAPAPTHSSAAAGVDSGLGGLY